jgi:argininosuccinate lyase
MSNKTWSGRFSQKTDRSVEKFTASINVDKRLYPYDIEGSIAHCRMLAHAMIITDDEAETLIQGLGKIKRELDHGDFQFDEGLEDIHMHIETRLVEEVGKVALKLHTARSRNDQVALDVRLFLRDETSQVISGLRSLQKVLVDLADTHIKVMMPGYTHLQRAQPVLFSHHLMAYYEMLKRDAARFQDCWERINVLPLGSAALAGTTYPIDRQYTAELLGFAQISANSIDTVSDRDFIIEFLSCASLCMVHLSRLSEELILWTSSEFQFIELPDAFATGSSIMPQKKNPDVPELVRGKSGRVIGNLMAMLSVMKALPLSYNRDLQEDKALLFDAVDTLQACLDIFARMLPKITINASVMQQATAKGYLNATDMADYLANKGMPFREAHHCVGRAVSHALQKNKELHELSLDELRDFSKLITEDIFDILSTQAMIDRRKSVGGTATENVVAAIASAKQELADFAS